MPRDDLRRSNRPSRECIEAGNASKAKSRQQGLAFAKAWREGRRFESLARHPFVGVLGNPHPATRPTTAHMPFPGHRAGG